MDGCGQLLLNIPSGRFPRNILGGVILVYNRYSEQSVYNLTRWMTLPPLFFGEIFENVWLRIVASEQSKRKISMKTFLLESFQYIIVTLNNSVCNLAKRITLSPVVSWRVFRKWTIGRQLLLNSPSKRFPRKHSWWGHFSI